MRATKSPTFTTPLALALTWVLVASPPGQAAEIIGAASAVVPSVTAQLAGTERALHISAAIHGDEVIEVASDGATELIFNDGSTLHIGPGTRLTLDEVVFDPDASRNIVQMTLSLGILRFSSGLTPDLNYRITTPTTVIGIRGTRFTASVNEDGETVVAVEDGLVTATNAAGESVTLQPGQFSRISPRRGTQPAPPPSAPAQTPEQVATVTTQLATRLAAVGARGMGAARRDAAAATPGQPRPATTQPAAAQPGFGVAQPNQASPGQGQGQSQPAGIGAAPPSSGSAGNTNRTQTRESNQNQRESRSNESRSSGGSSGGNSGGGGGGSAGGRQ